MDIVSVLQEQRMTPGLSLKGSEAVSGLGQSYCTESPPQHRPGNLRDHCAQQDYFLTHVLILFPTSLPLLINASLSLSLSLSLCVCVCVCVCFMCCIGVFVYVCMHCVCVGPGCSVCMFGGQRTASGCLLPTCGSRGSNTGH